MKFIFGLILGIIIAGGISWYLNKIQPSVIDQVKLNDNVANKPVAVASSDPITLLPSTSFKEAPVDKNQTQDENYDFYDVLPGNKSIADQNKLSTGQSDQKYYVQIGVFHNDNDANDLKAKLALQGITTIIKVTSQDSGMLNRVVVGPINNLEQANRILMQLQDQQISGMIVKN